MGYKGALIVQLSLTLFLVACSAVGPDYKPPHFAPPSDWQSKKSRQIRVGKAVDNKILAKWWKVLGDPVLVRLEEEAVKSNLDIKVAVSRVWEARYAIGFEKARLYPTVDSTGSYSRKRSGLLESETDFFDIGFNSSWELDIFRGTRRSVEAAIAKLEAAEANLQDVLVTLTADVALTYISYRTFKARIKVAKDNIRIQRETYELNKSRYEAGLADELIAQQALYNLERTRSLVPTLEIGLEWAKNKLAVLLGKTPREINSFLLSSDEKFPEVPREVVVGIPADVLRRRPDVRRAEKDLHTATALIGVATADLYPRFHLFGTIGLESIHATDLFNWSSRFWEVGPGFTWRIFDAGSIKQNIKIQTERQKQALLNYEKTILKALEEVENALIAFEKEQERRESLLKAVSAAEKSEQLASDRYNAGLVDFVTVLDAQRARQALQDDLVQSNGAVVSNLVRLYRALGGGWENWKGLVRTSD